MPLARVFAEFRTKGLAIDVENSLKQLKLALGEIYSGGNLGLNVRSTTVDLTLDVTDAIMLSDPAGGTITATLAAANSWSTTATKKSPFVIIRNTGAGTTRLLAGSGDNIEGAGLKNVVGLGTQTLLYTDGVSSWYVLV